MGIEDKITEFEFLENPIIPPELMSLIQDGEIIIFIGNGVSRLAEVPSWDKLALKYLHKYKSVSPQLTYDAFEKLKATKPLRLLSICIKRLGFNIAQLAEFLQVSKDKEKQALKIYGYIKDFKTGYITTNYDPFMMDAIYTPDDLRNKELELLKFINKKEDALIEVGFDDAMIRPQNKILYLHGKAFSKGNTGINDMLPILTQADYMQHYREKGTGRIFLRDVFKQAVLFIGVGMDEFEILEHIQPPSTINGTHYILHGFSEYEKCIIPDFRDYYKDLKIQLIPFNKSRNGYHQLEHVLREWSTTIRHERIRKFEAIKNQVDIISKIDGLQDERSE